MLTRRDFLRTAAAFALSGDLLARSETGVWVNDVHSQLNRTRVRKLLRPRTTEELADVVRSAARKNLPIAVSGCRHSMGGQQFATDGLCIDTRSLNRVACFDAEQGLVTAQAGVQWPALIRTYLDAQRDTERNGASRKNRPGPTRSRWAEVSLPTSMAAA